MSKYEEENSPDPGEIPITPIRQSDAADLASQFQLFAKGVLKKTHTQKIRAVICAVVMDHPTLKDTAEHSHVEMAMMVGGSAIDASKAFVRTHQHLCEEMPGFKEMALIQQIEAIREKFGEEMPDLPTLLSLMAAAPPDSIKFMKMDEDNPEHRALREQFEADEASDEASEKAKSGVMEWLKKQLH